MNRQQVLLEELYSKIRIIQEGSISAETKKQYIKDIICEFSNSENIRVDEIINQIKKLKREMNKSNISQWEKEENNRTERILKDIEREI